MSNMFTFILDLFSSFRKHFKPLKKLGSGSFGSVHLVERRATKQLYASKVIKKKHIARHAVLANTMDTVPMEIANMLSLDHHNIIELHGYLQQSRSWVLVLEYSPNYCDVRQFVRTHGPMTERLARHVYLQVYSAVTYCFQEGVHHRDIKDQNVLINQHTGHVKLIDFGSSSRGSLLKPYTTASGTLLYIPPEYFTEKQYLPHPAAVWSMGCLLYIMLSARDPFKNISQLLNKDLLDFIPLDISYEAKFFLLHSLHKDKSQRLKFTEVPLHLWILLGSTKQ